jgi:hypothetical protein
VAGDRAGSGTRRRAADRAGLTGLRAGTARAVVGREVVSRMADGRSSRGMSLALRC